jgi:hypothetical protein
MAPPANSEHQKRLLQLRLELGALCDPSLEGSAFQQQLIGLLRSLLGYLEDEQQRP